MQTIKFIKYSCNCYILENNTNMTDCECELSIYKYLDIYNLWPLESGLYYLNLDSMYLEKFETVEALKNKQNLN